MRDDHGPTFHGHGDPTEWARQHLAFQAEWERAKRDTPQVTAHTVRVTGELVEAYARLQAWKRVAGLLAVALIVLLASVGPWT